MFGNSATEVSSNELSRTVESYPEPPKGKMYGDVSSYWRSTGFSELAKVNVQQ